MIIDGIKETLPYIHFNKTSCECNDSSHLVSKAHVSSRLYSLPNSENTITIEVYKCHNEDVPFENIAYIEIQRISIWLLREQNSFNQNMTLFSSLF